MSKLRLIKQREIDNLEDWKIEIAIDFRIPINLIGL